MHENKSKFADLSRCCVEFYMIKIYGAWKHNSTFSAKLAKYLLECKMNHRLNWIGADYLFWIFWVWDFLAAWQPWKFGAALFCFGAGRGRAGGQNPQAEALHCIAIVKPSWGGAKRAWANKKVFWKKSMFFCCYWYCLCPKIIPVMF